MVLVMAAGAADLRFGRFSCPQCGPGKMFMLLNLRVRVRIWEFSYAI